jgi:hypothetical protein
MVAAADGRAGRSVIRLSERDGEVAAAVVGRQVGPPAYPEQASPERGHPGRPDADRLDADRLDAGRPDADRFDAGRPDAGRDHRGGSYSEDTYPGWDPAYAAQLDGEPAYPFAMGADTVDREPGYPGVGYSEAVEAGATGAEPAPATAQPAWLPEQGSEQRSERPPAEWSAERLAERLAHQSGNRAEQRSGQGSGQQSDERADDRGNARTRPDLRLVADLPFGRHASPDHGDEDEPDDEAGPGPAGRVELPRETSEVVARLAQLLRDDPTLAAAWGREAQET